MRPVARRARFVARKRSPDLRIQQFLGHHDRVLAPDVRGVVARAAADLVEAFVVVQRDRMRVRRPHLEEHALGAVPAGELEQRAQQAPAEPLALQLRIDADVQYVRLVGGNAEHRSEEHTSEIQSLMRNSYAVFCTKTQQNLPRQLNTEVTNKKIQRT